MDSEREQFEKWWYSKEGDAALIKGQDDCKTFAQLAYTAGRLAQREQDAQLADAEGSRWQGEADKHKGYTLGMFLGAKADLMKSLACAIREAGGGTTEGQRGEK